MFKKSEQQFFILLFNSISISKPKSFLFLKLSTSPHPFILLTKTLNINSSPYNQWKMILRVFLARYLLKSNICYVKIQICNNSFFIRKIGLHFIVEMIHKNKTIFIIWFIHFVCFFFFCFSLNIFYSNIHKHS